MAVEIYKIKMFLWDQLVRPIKSMINLKNIQAITLACIIINMLVYRSVKAFLIFLVVAFGISIYDLIKYYKSGEFINNYRKEKYGNYKKAIKESKNRLVKEETAQEIIDSIN